MSRVRAMRCDAAGARAHLSERRTLQPRLGGDLAALLGEEVRHRSHGDVLQLRACVEFPLRQPRRMFTTEQCAVTLTGRLLTEELRHSWQCSSSDVQARLTHPKRPRSSAVSFIRPMEVRCL